MTGSLVLYVLCIRKAEPNLSSLGCGPANPGVLCPHPLGPRVLRREVDPEHDADGAVEADHGELWAQFQAGPQEGWSGVGPTFALRRLQLSPTVRCH